MYGSFQLREPMHPAAAALLRVAPVASAGVRRAQHKGREGFAVHCACNRVRRDFSNMARACRTECPGKCGMPQRCKELQRGDPITSITPRGSLRL